MSHTINKSTLQSFWKSYSLTTDTKVLPFYGHRTVSTHRHVFSNFWQHDEITFLIPDGCGQFAGVEVSVNSAEKAIMLCKASLHHDGPKFAEILKTTQPKQAKLLGRKTKFNQDLWDEWILKIAFGVLLNKFSKNTFCQNILLETKNAILVEASPRDKIWGVGLSEHNPKIHNPRLWNGTNILGWSLMAVRKHLSESL